jgi:hypothetical protein
VRQLSLEAETPQAFSESVAAGTDNRFIFHSWPLIMSDADAMHHDGELRTIRMPNINAVTVLEVHIFSFRRYDIPYVFSHIQKYEMMGLQNWIREKKAANDTCRHPATAASGLSPKVLRLQVTQWRSVATPA